MPTSPDASDRDLLAGLRRGRDVAALAEVVRRHGGLVHGVCLRRCGPERAAAACVTVFRDLLARPQLVTGALPLWLHAAALARSDGGPGHAPAHGEPLWQALAPAIDPAIAALPPLARWHLLMALGTLPARGHGRAQARELAEPLAEPIAAAVAELAGALAGTGTRIDGPALAGLLDRNLIELPPPSAAADLGRLALGALPTASEAPETPAARRARIMWRLTIGGLVLALLIAVAVWALAAWHAGSHPRAPAAGPGARSP